MTTNPFEDFEDIALIKMARKNDSYAIKELVNRYGKVYDSAIRRICFESEYVKNDMLDDKLYFFYSMTKEYDESRNMKFSTFLYNRATWAALAEVKNIKRMSDTLKLDISDVQLNMPEAKMLVDRVSRFEPRAKFIFEKRFFSRKKQTFKTIGKKLGLSYEGVRKIYIKHLEILKKINKKYE